MYQEIEQLLHQRVRQACSSLFLDSHFPQAVAEAFKQVDLAVQEKTGYQFYGRKLVQHAFGSKGGPRLTVHQDEKASKAAREYFEAAFAYYRNHAVHVGAGIDDTACARALIVASELLDLLQASELHFSSLEELEALAKQRGFSSVKDLRRLLHFLDGYVIVDLCVDGLFERLAERGWGNEEYKFVFEVGLMEFQSAGASTQQNDEGVEEIEEFRLTAQGAKILGNHVGA